MNCGLLGGKLGHSYSPQIHSYFGDYSYDLFEKAPNELEDFLKHGDFAGLNVTIPYKKDVIPYCDALSPVAKQLGAVNTIVRRQDGTLIGHNSDLFGFSSMVKRSGIAVSGKKVLILGSGGASNTAVFALKEMGANVVVISRSGENHYNNLHRHADASVIINTTPVGMYPHVGVSPVSLTHFPMLEGVLDVIYNPGKTQLLLDAEKLGIPCFNGLWMLVAQAVESAQWFTGKPISESLIPVIYRKLQQQMENIVLIGMPGCGKSTIGMQLAQALNKRFVDADTCIEAAAGCTIPEIFANGGEDAFRRLESQVLENLGKCSGTVIATGGGCVTRPENYPYLHQNGTIIWIKRELSLLATDGRPLSQNGHLEQMYHTRQPLYQAFADITVENSSSVIDTVNNICHHLEAQI